MTATEAKWLDVILYSREQLIKEYEAMPSKEGAGQEVGGAAKEQDSCS